MNEERLQVLEIEEQHAFGVGDAEDDIQNAFLRVVQIHHAREQKRPHLGNRRADRVALLAEQIPEDHGELVGLKIDADILRALQNKIFFVAGLGNSRQIALDIGGKYRNAGARKPFGEHLQRHGLAGAGGAGDEAVPVGEFQGEIFGLNAFADENLVAGAAASDGVRR